MFCAGFHDINSCRLDAGMTEQVRQFRDIFFEVVKCPRKQEIGYGEIENILKTAGFILFFLKKIAPLPCQIPESGRKSGHQVGKTALKWLDNTVKPCSKIGWRNRRFSTLQQRKKTVTSFSSQSYGADEGI